MKINFKFDRETKNTLRYNELSDPPAIGVVYVQKWAAKLLGDGVYPAELVVEISKE